MMPDNDLSVLGKRLRKVRKERGFTQERLSEASGVSVRHIAKIEKGVINPSYEILSALVTAMGVTFDAILSPTTEQEDAEIQEIIGLYKACPDDGRRLILATTRALANELMDIDMRNKFKK